MNIKNMYCCLGKSYYYLVVKNNTSDINKPGLGINKRRHLLIEQ